MRRHQARVFRLNCRSELLRDASGLLGRVETGLDRLLRPNKFCCAGLWLRRCGGWAPGKRTVVVVAVCMQAAPPLRAGTNASSKSGGLPAKPAKHTELSHPRHLLGFTTLSPCFLSGDFRTVKVALEPCYFSFLIFFASSEVDMVNTSRPFLPVSTIMPPSGPPTPEGSLHRAIDKFKANLSAEQLRLFSICNQDDVYRTVAEIQKKHGPQRTLRNMQRIGAFLEAMDHLGKSVEVFLNLSPFVCFIWVSTYYPVSCLEAATASVKSLCSDRFVFLGAYQVPSGSMLTCVFFGFEPRLSRVVESYAKTALTYLGCSVMAQVP